MKLRLNKTRYSTRQIINWLWTHHRGCRTQAAVNVIIGVLLVATGLVNVELIRRLTDVATGSREGDLLLLAAFLVGILAAELLLHAAQTWVGAVLGVRTQNKMQQYFFARILRGKWQGIERFHSGDVVNRLFGDVNDIVNLMTEVLPFLVVIVVQFMASFFYLFRMDATLAWILIIVCPVIALFSRYYMYRMRRYVRKVKDSNSAIQAIIQESIQHKMVIKVLQQGENMISRLERRQQLLRRQVKSRARFSILTKSIVHLGFAGSYLVALTYGVFQLQDHAITVGVLFAFTQLIGKIQRPLIDMMRLLPSFVSSFTSSERLIELEELPLEASPHGGNGGNSPSKGLRLEHINYSYGEGKRKIFDDFSYDFAPGSFTAILGPTGSGKTTLLRLMLDLIQPQHGRVTLYGEDRTWPTSVEARQWFSYVPQGNTLFSGTIRDNLLFGNPNATVAELHEVLALAKADFVFTLPDGIYTRCGEQGGGLSEGQAQRIAIARALLRPCNILLLDEATSALDIETEEAVLTNIKNHYADKTIIFVTHRLTAVNFATGELRLQR